MGEFYKEIERKDPSPFDRYKNCKILIDLETKETLLETREIKKVNLSSMDSYHTVDANEEGRLDLIAYQYYGNPLLWWVIAQANDIYNVIENPKPGDIIRIPDISNMYNKDGILK